jgi:hypothetical protein
MKKQLKNVSNCLTYWCIQSRLIQRDYLQIRSNQAHSVCNLLLRLVVLILEINMARPA